MGSLMIYMAFMPLYMSEMWDVTPVTNGHTDGQWKVVQYSVWAESAINGVHCESTQVSRKFPGRSAAWENARSLATDGKAEQCRLPMFLSGLVKTKHLEELQKQSGRVAQTPKERLCLHLELEVASICIFCICWSQYCCSFEIEVPHCSLSFLCHFSPQV